MTLSVLVVCLGNICRSPMGEAVLKHVAEQRGIEIHVDSAGTAAYHAGEDPDDRTIATCKKHKVPIKHKARKVKEEDYTTFTHILASDKSNLSNLQYMKPDISTAEIRMWGSYLDGKPIGDPYYGGQDGFEEVYEQCVRYSNAFLDAVTKTDSE
ncbi:phosphotyrosine phosphatase [Pyrrhoderma noxium]|uniref:Phosphotyrosine phosphatase n=1 Tax=Pyrrhoderma noxium TaxID=2282107 RepID=A0A286UQT8_9AGAM|nr:phosphotyrosine phosphatase [Pyrrhoderma noxium]